MWLAGVIMHIDLRRSSDVRCIAAQQDSVGSWDLGRSKADQTGGYHLFEERT